MLELNFNGSVPDGEAVSLESRYPWLCMFVRLYLLPWQDEYHCSLYLSILPRIYAPGTQFSWMAWGSVEFNVYLTLLHMTHLLKTFDLKSNTLQCAPYCIRGASCHALSLVVVFQWFNSYSASRNNWCTVGGDGGCRVGEVRASLHYFPLAWP